MSRLRIEATGTLVVLSPLHVGTGEGRAVTAVTRASGSNTPPEVAAIQRDAQGCPWIPGSTLKGLLRRVAQDIPPASQGWMQRLLGRDAGPNQANALMGALLVRGAVLARAGNAAGMPYADPTQTQLGASPAAGMLGGGVYVAARTALSPALGIARQGRLFFQEVVAPGAEFAWSLLLDLRAPATDLGAARTQLLDLLWRLTAEAGVAIGASQSDGQGRVRLRWERLRLSQGTLGVDGRMAMRPTQVQNRQAAAPRPASRRWVLELRCAGPFAVLDGSHPSRRSENDPQVAAQRNGALPILPGASLMGVLRARAAWLSALAALRQGNPGRQDDRDAVFRSERATPLTSVQRLFGVAGYRGLLEMASLRVTAARRWNVYSVKLDRFSGAPIDNALFETDCFTGVQARAVIELSSRPAPQAARAAAQALAESLMADLAEEGVRIGHATNRGFGWFEVTVREEPGHAAA